MLEENEVEIAGLIRRENAELRQGIATFRDQMELIFGVIDSRLASIEHRFNELEAHKNKSCP